MRVVSFLLLLGSAVACDPDNPADGRDATPTTVSVKHHGGLGLEPLGEPYIYEHVEHDGRHMLWLEQFLRRPVTGRTGRMAVLDVYDLGVLPEGYWVQNAGCWPDDGRRPGVEEQAPTEPDLAVVVRYTPPTARFSTDMTHAVRVNWSQKRFEPLAAAGWVCEWQGSGD